MSLPTATPAGPERCPQPPKEVLDAIAAAASVYEQLAAEGREVRFDVDPESGRVRAEMRDLAGAKVARLSAGDVIDLAAGESRR